MKNYLLTRLREPSTWASLSALAVCFGAPVAAPVIIKIGVAVTAILGVAIPETK